MTEEKVAKLVEYLLQSERTVQDLDIHAPYKRRVWGDLERHLFQFLNGDRNQWIIMPGLRGVGKTTLLAQLYNHPALTSNTAWRRFYLSFEKLALRGFVVDDLVEALKQLRRIYKDQSFLVCLDEVHLDSQWSLGCKLVFDQVSRTFLVCTGSSALSLRLNPDSARRASVIKVPPLSFSEFVAIKQLNCGLPKLDIPNPQISQTLQTALFDSAEATAVYESLQSCVDEIETYYTSLAANEALATTVEGLLEEYIQGYGSLPLALSPPMKLIQLNLMNDTRPLDNSDVKDRLIRLLNQTLTADVLKLLAAPKASGSVLEIRLQASTVSLLPKLANILANSEQTSLRTIAKDIGGIQIPTVQSMLKVLIQSDIIAEIPARGSAKGRSTKTSKYLFTAPALRRALTLSPSSTSSLAGGYDRKLRGRLLEDAIYMQLERSFSQPSNRRLIEYDSRSGAADFVITTDGLKGDGIAIEVGYSKTEARQVRQTLKAGGRYGLIITAANKFALDLNNKAVYVPLRYFLLI